MKTKLVVLTGAGVSAESGLGTYRDNGGLWDNYDPMEVASIQGWLENPGKVLDFYNMQRSKLAQVKPNGAHLALAEMEKDYDVTIITQNVDNLHERAGSSHVIHLHGEVTKIRPEHGIYDRTCSEAEVEDIGYSDVVLGDRNGNGVQMRPHIVFFGENVPKMEDAIEQVSDADILVIIGTSLSVYPAANLYMYAPSYCRIFMIDPKEAPVRISNVTHIKATAVKGMEQLECLLSQMLREC